MKIFFPNETDPAKLHTVIDAMATLGPPVVRAVARDGVWYAIEGSHRIVAADTLALPVLILPCSEKETVTWSTDIRLDGFRRNYFGRNVSEILWDVYDARSGTVSFSEDPPFREIPGSCAIEPGMPKNLVTQKLLENFFGDEKRMGVWDDGTMAFLPGDYGDFGICTNGAQFVVDTVGGIVVGFDEGRNPSAHKAFRDGHDFALVAGRFLVDLWAKAYPCVNKDAVIDLADPGQISEHLHKYGDVKTWEVVEEPDLAPGSYFIETGVWRKFALTDLDPVVRKRIGANLRQKPQCGI